jgi:4-diphosphocytidyl-2-C-methyl-D-erythritol kinase
VISAKAPGKINLFFQVGPVLENGYHNVVSLYQAVDLFETVGTEPASTWQLEVQTNGIDVSNVPLDETNLVIKAAKALSDYVGIVNPQPMRFVIDKQIPVAGGMAGGSADAAAALIALNEAWCLGLEQKQLIEVAAKVGADVPFAIVGGTALGTSTGVELEKVGIDFDKYIVLILNPEPLSTKAVFDHFDELGMGEVLVPLSPQHLLERVGYNSLEAAAFSLLPSTKDIANQDFGISRPHLSGSGPTMWCYADNQADANAGAERVRSFGYQAIITRTSTASGALI